MNANFIASIHGYRYIWTFSVASLYRDATFSIISYNSLQLLSRLLIAPSQCLQSLEQCA